VMEAVLLKKMKIERSLAATRTPYSRGGMGSPEPVWRPSGPMPACVASQTSHPQL
jgi:hypothetical protein